MRLFFLAVLLLGLSGVSSVFAQEARILKMEAEELFSFQKYSECLSRLEQYRALQDWDEDLYLTAGRCFYELGRLPEAEAAFLPFIQEDRESDPAFWLWMGRLRHAQSQFQDAVRFYKTYLKKTDADVAAREMVKDQILRCSVGMRLQYKESVAIVENLGPYVNTAREDFAPILSPNYENRLYFASNREESMGGLRNEEGIVDPLAGTQNSDMYSTRSDNRGWKQAERLSTLLNSPANDVILDFDQTGRILYFFKGFSLFSGEIFADTFRTPSDERPLFPTKLSTPAIAENGDVDIFFFRDSILFFSSRREGGFGGSDLYFAVRRNGEWLPAENLGPSVNTAYDERTPFLCADGKTLFFSTNNCRNSIGGFDLVKSVYSQKENDWMEPENPGPPLNSPADELYFRLAIDGVKAYFSSDRKEGEGGMDIYMALFRELQEYQLAFSSSSFWQISRSKNQEAEGDKIKEGNKVLEDEGESVASSFTLNPIYYQEDEDVLRGSNLQQLDLLAAFLKSAPEAKIAILSFSDDREQPEKYDLYFCLKRAEKARDHLIRQGVKPYQVFIQGLASDYPIASSTLGGAPNPAGQKANQRLEFLANTDPEKTPELIVNMPQVSSFMKREEGAKLREKLRGLSYRIELATATGVYNDDAFANLSGAVAEKRADEQLYYYCAGLFKQYTEATDFMKELESEGYKNLKIRPYINGVPLADEEVPYHVGSYPDLLRWIAGK
jgi:outer membrane protein OmpA-like peptidoglycan-associated protein